VPTYRVSYEIAYTLHVNVEADSKNAAAEIVRDMEESRIGIGKCDEVVIARVEQYFSANQTWYGMEAYPVDSGCFQIGSYWRCNGR
jgi:hypothetical protein